MSNLTNKTLWTIEDIHSAILNYGDAETLWRAIEGNRPLHPLIRDLIDRGMVSRRRDPSFVSQELNHLHKHNRREYDRRVHDVERAAQAVQTQTVQVSKAKSAVQKVISRAIEEYRASVLATFIFNGKELGMMNSSDLTTAYNVRKNRSETEFKQAAFLKQIADQIGNKLVKDVLTPKQADQLWKSIKCKTVELS